MIRTYIRFDLGTALQSNHEDQNIPNIVSKRPVVLVAEIGGGIGNMVSSGSAPQLDAQMYCRSSCQWWEIKYNKIN
jgi:hypothetical protein